MPNSRVSSLDQLGALDGDVADAVARPGRRRRGAAAGRWNCRGGRWRAWRRSGFERAADQFLAGLRQHLDRDVVRDAALSIRRRTKSNSVCEAEGKPTSISLKPMPTSVSNMRSLRSWPIGSIRAWLPSRRSTAHQIGAWVMVRDGHWRSGKSIGGQGLYLAAKSILGRGELRNFGSVCHRRNLFSQKEGRLLGRAISNP